MTIGVVSGSFTATGQSGTLTNRYGGFNITLLFGEGTVDLERSFDNGTTWFTVKSYSGDAADVAEDPESGTVYRLNCTDYTSEIVYRLSH